MKTSKITSEVRDSLRDDPRTLYDETHLLFRIFEFHGLSLTCDQKAVIADLPNPKSVLRIAEREKKRLQGATKL